MENKYLAVNAWRIMGNVKKGESMTYQFGPLILFGLCFKQKY